MKTTKPTEPKLFPAKPILLPPRPRKRILYLHGSSANNSMKAIRLAYNYKVCVPELGFGKPDTISAATQMLRMITRGFREPIRVAQEAIEAFEPEVIVASSLGAMVGMSVDLCGARLVLIAPAWSRSSIVRFLSTYFPIATPVIKAAIYSTLPAVPPSLPLSTRIVHSLFDDVIPFSDSMKIVDSSGLPEEALRAIGYNHRMNSWRPMDAVRDAIDSPEDFLLGPKKKYRSPSTYGSFVLGGFGLYGTEDNNRPWERTVWDFDDGWFTF